MNELSAYNKSLDRQLAVLKQILLKSEPFLQIFESAPMLGLPNWYVGAGFVVQTVWNALSGFPLLQNIKDVDLVYFDDCDLAEETERKVAAKAARLFGNLPIELDVINQARVHLWYERHFGYPIVPYKSVEGALTSSPS